MSSSPYRSTEAITFRKELCLRNSDPSIGKRYGSKPNYQKGTWHGCDTFCTEKIARSNRDMMHDTKRKSRWMISWHKSVGVRCTNAQYRGFILNLYILRVDSISCVVKVVFEWRRREASIVEVELRLYHVKSVCYLPCASSSRYHLRVKSVCSQRSSIINSLWPLRYFS